MVCEIIEKQCWALFTQSIFFGCSLALWESYLWNNSCLVLYVLAEASCLFGNAVAAQSVDLVLDGQVFGLLILISFKTAIEIIIANQKLIQTRVLINGLAKVFTPCSSLPTSRKRLYSLILQLIWTAAWAVSSRME